MRRFLLLGLLALALTAGAIGDVRAQAGPVVQVGQAFALVGVHNGTNTTGYSLAISPGGYSATLPVSALVGNQITFEVPGLATAGNYTAVITATGPGGSTPSAPFAFAVVVAAPAAVTNIQLIPR